MSLTDADATIMALRPDVLVLDVEVRRENSLPLASCLRTELPGMATVVVTFRDDVETASAAVRAGVLGFVVKDAEPSDLLHAIRAAARGEAWIQPRLLAPVLGELTRHPGTLTPDQQKLARLSEREQDVLGYMVRGYDRGNDRGGAVPVVEHRPDPHAEPSREARRPLEPRGGRGRRCVPASGRRRRSRRRAEPRRRPGSAEVGAEPQLGEHQAVDQLVVSARPARCESTSRCTAAWSISVYSREVGSERVSVSAVELARYQSSTTWAARSALASGEHLTRQAPRRTPDDGPTSVTRRAPCTRAGAPACSRSHPGRDTERGASMPCAIDSLSA